MPSEAAPAVRPSHVARPSSRRYDMLHIDYAADAAEEEKKIKDKLQKAKAAKPKPAKPAAKQQSKLAAPVKSLMQLIFDVKQMTASVVEMKYDIKKLPLGKLTAAQIAAGYQALKECETLMNANTYVGRPHLLSIVSGTPRRDVQRPSGHRLTRCRGRGPPSCPLPSPEWASRWRQQATSFTRESRTHLA